MAKSEKLVPGQRCSRGTGGGSAKGSPQKSTPLQRGVALGAGPASGSPQKSSPSAGPK